MGVINMNVLILDMDGTVRIKKGGVPGQLESGFISHPKDQEIIPGAVKAIEKYHQEGWIIVGASNQGGVAAGKKTLESCFKEQRYTIQLAPKIYRIYFCPDYEGKQLGIVARSHSYLFEPKDNVYYKGLRSFRKPEPGMIQYIQSEYERGKILFVGDRPEDEQAADKAGVDFQWASDWWIGDRK